MDIENIQEILDPEMDHRKKKIKNKKKKKIEKY